MTGDIIIDIRASADELTVGDDHGPSAICP